MKTNIRLQKLIAQRQSTLHEKALECIKGAGIGSIVGVLATSKASPESNKSPSRR